MRIQIEDGRLYMNGIQIYVSDYPILADYYHGASWNDVYPDMDNDHAGFIELLKVLERP
jgi:hypothetical protein